MTEQSTRQVVPVEQAVGMVLPHDITEIVKDTFKGRAFKKGHIIRAEDIDHLRRLGKEHVYVLELGEQDIHENEAALRLAEALAGSGTEYSRDIVEGKVTIRAATDGLLRIDREALFRFNLLGEVMCATLQTNTPVSRGEQVAATRLIPLVGSRRLVERAVAEYGAEAVSCNDIYDVAAEVFAPCAMEGGIDAQTLERLKVKIVCGSANNQLASHAIGDELYRRGILYAPDYAVNAGGVMNVSLEIDGYNRERAMRMMRTIYHTVGRIFDLADKENIAPQYAADRIAEARMTAIGKLKLPLGRTAPRFMGHLRGEH